ncbi:MAG: STAS domain-containing protein [Planctomycetota bacterium]|nr:STAS domain-containing protein [Planctomycetota bacterium]
MSTSTFVSTQIVGTAVIARIHREKYTEHECAALEAELGAAAATSKHRLVIDMTEVMLIASAGLGSLVTLDKACKKNGGKLAMYGLSDQLRQVFEITRLHKLLLLAKDRDAAVKAVS